MNISLEVNTKKKQIAVFFDGKKTKMISHNQNVTINIIIIKIERFAYFFHKKEEKTRYNNNSKRICRHHKHTAERGKEGGKE